MPAAPVKLSWGEHVVEVAPDGSARLRSPSGVVARLTMESTRVTSRHLTGPDEVEFGVVASGLPGSQRHSVAEHWRLRWVLHNPGPTSAAVRLPLRIEPGEGWSAWSWAGDAHGIVLLTDHRQPGALALVLDQGRLCGTPAAGAPMLWQGDDAGPGVLQAAGPGQRVPPGGRYAVSFTARVLAGPEEAAGLLPPWAGGTVLAAGDAWSAPLADAGLDLPPPLRSWLDAEDGRVQISGAPGRHVVSVHHPRGVTAVPLDWAPTEDRTLTEWVARLSSAPGTLTPADAFCVQVARDRGLLGASSEVEDRLDRLDWTQSDSPFAVAFGVARGLAEGEAVVVSAALDRLSGLPVGIGYARTVMRAWLASVSLAMERQSSCLALLGRPASDPIAGLENALLHYRSHDSSGAQLAGIVRRSGGDVPGDPLLAGWSEQAALAGVLRLCPEGWPEAAAAAESALKTRRRVLAAYADGRIVDSEPLAWLLLDIG